MADPESVTAQVSPRVSKITGEYFGQAPPGSKPELFAPGIISLPDIFEHSAAIFSPDKSEVYWSGKPNGTRYFKIYCMKMVDGRWAEREIAFSHRDYSFRNPVLSHDGDRLFFDSRDDIWFVERAGDDWTEPVQVSPQVNSGGLETLRSITRDESIYFSRYNADAPNEGSRHEIYVSRKIDDKYMEPEKLAKGINSDDMLEFGLYVAPDESYMIIEASKDRRDVSLFISYRGRDGSWSERMELPIGWASFPSVSPDGKYLFFMSREGISWVNTSFIEDLRPDER
jgi:Tol biopolymer transport system component